MEPNHKQKVLMVHNFYQIPGGEDIVVANEKRLLEEHGHEVVLHTRHNNELKSMTWIKKIGLPFTTIFNPRTYREVKKIIKEEGIEIVHIHNTLNLVSPSAYYAAVKCGVPVVQTIHNFRFLCPGATFYRDGYICEDCVGKGLGCAVKHKCYRNSRLQTLVCVVNTWIHRHTGILGKINYICLTDFNKEKLLQLKQIKTEKVFVKPNFADMSTTNLESRKRQIVYVGRLENIKGTQNLLNAWKQYGEKAPKLLVCGEGSLWDWSQDFIKKNTLSNVELLGYVEHNHVLQIISQSIALILPTCVYEGFPMTIVEAYGMGTPVITTDLGNAGDLVEDGVTGYKFQHNSVASMITAIKKAEKEFDEERMSTMTKTIQKIFYNKYSKEKNYQLLSEVYNDIGKTGI